MKREMGGKRGNWSSLPPNKFVTVEEFTRHVPALISLTFLSAFVGVSIASAPEDSKVVGQIAGMIFVLTMFHLLMDIFWDARVCRHHLKAFVTFILLGTLCLIPFEHLSGASWVNGSVVAGVLSGWLGTVTMWSVYIGGSKDDEIQMKEDPF